MRKNDKSDASLLFLAVIALILAAGVTVAITMIRSERLEDDRVINTLFVIENEGKPLCTFVLLYYPSTKRAAIFDIPGSVGILLKSVRRVDRIDSAYDAKKISVYKDEIISLLDVDIPYSIIINIEDLGKLTDLLEGVEIFIPTSVSIFHDNPILFSSGITRLDGDKAKQYVTYELPEENTELHVLRKQRFFGGLLKRIGEQSEILKHKPTSKLFYSFMKTSMNQRNTNWFFGEFAKIDMDRTNIQSVGGNLREISGQMLIVPSWDGALIKDIVKGTLASLIAENGRNERVLSVDIQNGTQVSGLAGRTAELVRGFGYEVNSVGNADRNDYARTLIIDHTGRESLVQEFGKIIRCTNIEYRGGTNQLDEHDIELMNFEYKADFTLIIGRDFNERFVTGN